MRCEKSEALYRFCCFSSAGLVSCFSCEKCLFYLSMTCFGAVLLLKTFKVKSHVACGKRLLVFPIVSLELGAEW